MDLGLVLGIPGGTVGRFIALRLGNRQVALSVDEVVGVRDLDGSTIRELPPLLHEASEDFVEAIGTLDSHFLVVLRAGWRVPQEVWQMLTEQEVAP